MTAKKEDDSNNNQQAHVEEFPPQTSTTPTLPTLASQPTAAASVVTFYHRLQRSHGPVLDSLHNEELCLGGDLAQEDYIQVLELLAREQMFEVKFVQPESLDNVEQSLVQIYADGQPHAVTVCMGMGPFSKNFAARYVLKLFFSYCKFFQRSIIDIAIIDIARCKIITFIVYRYSDNVSRKICTME